jgi:hypothetical protein
VNKTGPSALDADAIGPVFCELGTGDIGFGNGENEIGLLTFIVMPNDR